MTQLPDFDRAFTFDVQTFARVVSLDARQLSARHNVCVVRVERGELEAGERCLSELLALLRQGSGSTGAGAGGGLDSRTVAEHLQLVRSRIRARRTDASPQTAPQSASKPLDAPTAAQP